tara:strand:+ start:5299 stop:6264 length:966 start_codon:yes stop_codon:yes gene_type:complete
VYLPDLYDCFGLDDLRQKQVSKAWSISEFSKFKTVDLTKSFAPIDTNFILYDKLSPNELLVVSQFLGLVINSAICELELAIERSKKECYQNIIERFPVSVEFEELAENFFKEEKKHSEAFDLFLTKFAETTKVTRLQIRQILPTLNESKIEKFFRLNGIIGGQALWLVTAATEEESIEVFKKMRPHKNEIDPFFYHLHRRHFEEETRHASFAFLMLELINDRSSLPIKKVSQCIDFILSDLLQVSWVLSELVKTDNVHKLKDSHPFYESLSNVLPKISGYNIAELISYLFKESPFVSLILNPRSNKVLSNYLREKNYLSIR